MQALHKKQRLHDKKGERRGQDSWAQGHSKWFFLSPLLLLLFSLEQEAEEDSLLSLTASCLANTSLPAVIFEDKF